MKPKQGDHREKYCLLFHQFKHVIGKQYNSVEQVISTVKKNLNHSPWQKAEVCRRLCRHNMQWFRLSLRQFLCQLIAEAYSKTPKSQHFIADVQST